MIWSKAESEDLLGRLGSQSGIGGREGAQGRRVQARMGSWAPRAVSELGEGWPGAKPAEIKADDHPEVAEDSDRRGEKCGGGRGLAGQPLWERWPAAAHSTEPSVTLPLLLPEKHTTRPHRKPRVTSQPLCSSWPEPEGLQLRHSPTREPRWARRRRGPGSQLSPPGQEGSGGGGGARFGCCFVETGSPALCPGVAAKSHGAVHRCIRLGS